MLIVYNYLAAELITENWIELLSWPTPGAQPPSRGFQWCCGCPLCSGPLPGPSHAICLLESIFLFQEMTENHFAKNQPTKKPTAKPSTCTSLSVFLLECREGCRNDQASRESGLNYAAMLNCGCGVDAGSPDSCFRNVHIFGTVSSSCWYCIK